MSGATHNVGGTLTSGIQDISALLPLIGTEQCEKHVGSALEGGYLYAAATPLSLFGSLGIVKVGISVLISSISIPKFSFSFRKFSFKLSQDRWLGARTLNNAGFQPAGTVAALIAMDGKRHKAETRLIEILEEKHIDNPENLSIDWKSRDWNIMLVLFTIVAAIISGTPYIALLLQNSQPSFVHTPWIFPLLRTVGSCLATVCCQFLLQSRVISLMNNRIIFMIMNRNFSDNPRLKNVLDHARDSEHLHWGADLPAEECLWSLEQFLASPDNMSEDQRSPAQSSEDNNKSEDHVSIEMKPLSFSDPQNIQDKLQSLRYKHFPTPAFDRTFVLISWIILCLSLPASVVGYIGCFTLVSNSERNGPLIWLGLEAMLSIVRIVVWAWNPSWDEKTEITVKLELTTHQPLVTTEKSIGVIQSTGNNTLALIPERKFLEWITPYTGPVEQFPTPENLNMYLTLTAATTGTKQKFLYITIFDFNKRIAVTLHREKEGFVYVDADVTCNHISSEMEAKLQSAIGEKHLWQTNNAILFKDLEKYHETITHALHGTHLGFATLHRKWNMDLLPEGTKFNNGSRDQVTDLPSPNEPDQVTDFPSLTESDQLYLDRGYEHHLKTELIENWSRWIVKDMDNIQSEARNDCHHALADATSEKAKWELTELDYQLVWEWTRRELSLLLSSTALEDILRQRMEVCINMVAIVQGNERLKAWLWSEFAIGQRKRLEKEREQTKERMEKGMKGVSERAEREGRLWRDQGPFAPQWEAGQEFIDKKWLAGIDSGHSALEDAVSELDRLVIQDAPKPYFWGDQGNTRLTFVKQVRQRFQHWHPQRENERLEMDVTIQRISDVDGEHPDVAYQYPEPDDSATAKFVHLHGRESFAKVSSATTYNAWHVDNLDVICEIIKKSTTRSVINVDPGLVDSIPENNHLLYLSPRRGNEPVFVQRNRDRWWDQQTSNSSTFYFSPDSVYPDGSSVISSGGTIAHIFIFLETPSRIRLRLLHQRYNDTSVSIQENSTELRLISSNEIPEKLQLQDFVLDQFAPGRHKLALVVLGDDDDGYYYLRDIFVEFLDNSPSPASVDGNGRNSETTDEPGDVDEEPSRTEDGNVEEGWTANSLPPDEISIHLED